ncbi:MAG: hypothetical protein AAF531_23270 [Actinomycetota bacterium]
MSYIGTGDEDWVELDLDLFERSRSTRLQTALVDQRERVVAAVGFDFDLDTTDDGVVFIVVDGLRRYRAELGPSGRLIFTGILDPEGPL